MMRRLLFAAASLLIATAPIAQADSAQYRDDEGRFTVTVPTGWLTERPEQKSSIAVIMASPQEQKAGGFCMVLADPTPQTRDTPQAELDEAFGQVLTKEFWTRSLAANGLKNIVLQDTGQKVQKGRKVYYFVATATVTDDAGKAFEATSKQVIHVVPGSLYFVQCTSTKSDYPVVSAQFETVFTSFEPRINELLVMGPRSAPSVLTLFSAPGFDGVAHAIAQNTANIPALTGRDVAAGISVAGYGMWEVCENVNFTGACQVVAATEMAEPGKVIRIGSVRRHAAANTDPRAAAGIIATEAGLAIKQAAERAAKH